MNMKCGRWILLFLCMLLFTACRVTVNVETDEIADAPAQEDAQEAQEADTEPGNTAEDTENIDAGNENAEPEGTDSGAESDTGEGQAEDTVPQETTPVETQDKEHTPIPDFDPTPLPGYESIVFIGDSRTLTMAEGGTYEFRLVPDDSVEATWGGELTDNTAFQNARLAARKHREKAVFWYGINDVQMNPQRDDVSVFINNYMKVIDAYLKIEPNSTIYIVSILSTTVRERDYYAGQEQNILNYNHALYRLCIERGWYYIDVTSLFTGDDCFEEGDNIHFSKAWYEERFLPYVTVFTGLNVYQ